MKIFKLIFTCLLFFITTNAFCQESYDFSPFGYNDNYDNGDNNYYYNYNLARNNYEQPRYGNRYSKYSSYSNHAKKTSQVYSGPGKTFVFDPKTLRWSAYYNGELINSGRASGGRYYCADIRRGCKTPSGIFRISHKGGPDCKSRKYPIGRGNAPMPWCMFFHKGFAIHGSWSVPNYNASHGCIRVPPPDARWLNTNFLTCGTKVVVKGYR
jgi:hypothetical protein